MATSTAIEQFFNKLVDSGELYSGIITDAQGRTIVECFGTPGGASPFGGGAYGSGGITSNNNQHGGNHAFNTSSGGGARTTSADPTDINPQYSNGNSRGGEGGGSDMYGGGGGGSANDDVGGDDIGADLYATNAVVCAAKSIHLLQQLQLGTPPYIAAQYRHHVIVHFGEGPCVVSLVGLKGMGHCIGSLTSLIATVKNAPIFRETIAAVKPELEKYM